MNLNEDIESLNKQNNKLINQLKENTENGANTEKINKQIENKLNEKIEELNSKINEYEDKINEANKEIDELNKENDDLSDKLIKKDRQITKLNKDINNLMQDNEEMNKDIDEFEKENVELKKSLKKLKKELGREIENNNNVNKEADDLFEKNIKISENYQKLQKKYEELFNNNKDKEAKIISLEKDLNNQADLIDFDSINSEQINTTNGNSNLIIKNLKAKNEELEQQILELENELKEQDEDLIELNNELKNKEEKVEECNNIINNIKEKNYELQKQIKDLTDNINSKDINRKKTIQYLNSSEKKKENGITNEIIPELFTPDNYNILKCIHLQINNKQYKWYILEKTNINKNKLSYEDFIFVSEKEKEKLNKFDLPLNDSLEKEKIISELETNLKTLEKKYKKKEKDFNVLNINFTNLLHQNRTSNLNQENMKNKIELLIEENQNLNRNLMKYSNKSNFLGLSFIEENDNDNHFFDDKCLEDILNELDGKTKIIEYKNKNRNDPYIKQNIVNNRNEKNFYSSANRFYPQNYKTIDNNELENDSIKKDNNNSIKNIKESFKLLANQIEPSSNAKITIASIMKQLGHNDNEIYKIIGYNQRGVISMPNSKNNTYKK